VTSRQQPARRPSQTWLTVGEVADELRISRMTVYRLIKAKEIPATQFGRSMRVSEAAVSDYVWRSYVGTDAL
jgi:excisionase family DNA binding protein